MSNMKASVTETKLGFHVEGCETISYDFTFVDGVFNIENANLANCYKDWGRVLAITDKNVYSLHGHMMEKYFKHYGLDLKVHQTSIGEKAKTIDTFLSICDSMTDFGIIRKEPVLVVGGGLVTDVAGFACASYRRNTNYIRIPTTVIGLIDASVSIKVAVNYGNYKNRLGAYHAPMHTFLDFTLIRTLPTAQVFNLLDKYCEQLIDLKFGRADGSPYELRKAADIISREAIFEMLRLESPNLHEIHLDRVIAYGHTWSPLHELVPETPLRHGHAISIDMAYSATIARQRGLLSEGEHRRLLTLFSRAGLAIDHPQFDEDVLDRGTAAILKTRDGKLRLAVPGPLGACTFLNDISTDELHEALRTHKALAKEYPRQGDGIEAFVDSSDTGYSEHDRSGQHVQGVAHKSDLAAGKQSNGLFNGILTNGHGNEHTTHHANGNAHGIDNGFNDCHVIGTGNGAAIGVYHGIANGVIGKVAVDGLVNV